MVTATLSLLRLAPLGLHSPHSAILRPLPHVSSIRRHSSFTCRAALPASDRLISALSYSLPFFNSLPYGRFIFARFPIASAAFSPLLPLVSAYRSIPFATFVAFFALYLGVVRNPNLSRYVRFNSMQAVVLDVLLALPVLFQKIIGTPSSPIAFRIIEVVYGAIFLLSCGCFIYSVLFCVLGRTARLPIIATAADRQL